MTRSRVVTLTAINTNYNLWTLITQDASFTDPTFTKAEYVPSRCCQLDLQSQDAATNAANGGSHISIMGATNAQAGKIIGSGDVSTLSSGGANLIDLKSIVLRSDTAGVKVNVQILSR